MQIDHHQIWETYVSAWKSGSVERVRRLLEASVAQRCSYQDPITKVSGLDDLMAYMSNFHQQVAGGHFVTRRFRFHHGQSVAGHA